MTAQPVEDPVHWRWMSEGVRLYLSFPEDRSKPHSGSRSKVCLFCRLGLSHTIALHRRELTVAQRLRVLSG